MKKYSLGFYYNIHIKEKLLFFCFNVNVTNERSATTQASREAQQQQPKINLQ